MPERKVARAISQLLTGVIYFLIPDRKEGTGAKLVEVRLCGSLNENPNERILDRKY